ncbi:GIY-YIG nuclease family protein [Sphingorhabdus soli]|uniref:GIY-YIG nuclease family protein n=2 Tax=Flavisphingopyxis soli TaxID=2601267 RepID=A0A5C6U4M4_9SPHN|nr:GIY-YIG nuclease family protein [Sphingorhabdus soli]TXC67837.1 GIY-YIG nuclease family protein [Sphingorhabdus soli]
MANRKQGAIYTGSTSNLLARIFQHRERLVEGHSKTYGCTRLVWFEIHDDLQNARHRELQIKKWKRSWKIRLIESGNPDWKDLWFDIRA